MSFWEPARMTEEVQFEIDKRVILNIAKEKLKKDLEKVNRKISKDDENREGINILSLTRVRRANMNIKRDNLAFEKMEIERRLNLIKEVIG